MGISPGVAVIADVAQYAGRALEAAVPRRVSLRNTVGQEAPCPLLTHMLAASAGDRWAYFVVNATVPERGPGGRL